MPVRWMNKLTSWIDSLPRIKKRSSNRSSKRGPRGDPTFCLGRKHSVGGSSSHSGSIRDDFAYVSFVHNGSVGRADGVTSGLDRDARSLGTHKKDQLGGRWDQNQQLLGKGKEGAIPDPHQHNWPCGPCRCPENGPISKLPLGGSFSKSGYNYYHDRGRVEGPYSARECGNGDYDFLEPYQNRTNSSPGQQPSSSFHFSSEELSHLNLLLEQRNHQQRFPNNPPSTGFNNPSTTSCSNIGKSTPRNQPINEELYDNNRPITDRLIVPSNPDRHVAPLPGIAPSCPSQEANAQLSCSQLGSSSSSIGYSSASDSTHSCSGFGSSSSSNNNNGNNRSLIRTNPWFSHSYRSPLLDISCLDSHNNNTDDNIEICENSNNKNIGSKDENFERGYENESSNFLSPLRSKRPQLRKVVTKAGPVNGVTFLKVQSAKVPISNLSNTSPDQNGKNNKSNRNINPNLIKITPNNNSQHDSSSMEKLSMSLDDSFCSSGYGSHDSSPESSVHLPGWNGGRLSDDITSHQRDVIIDESSISLKIMDNSSMPIRLMMSHISAERRLVDKSVECSIDTYSDQSDCEIDMDELYTTNRGPDCREIRAESSSIDGYCSDPDCEDCSDCVQPPAGGGDKSRDSFDVYCDFKCIKEEEEFDIVDLNGNFMGEESMTDEEVGQILSNKEGHLFSIGENRDLDSEMESPKSDRGGISLISDAQRSLMVLEQLTTKLKWLKEKRLEIEDLASLARKDREEAMIDSRKHVSSGWRIISGADTQQMLRREASDSAAGRNGFEVAL